MVGEPMEHKGFQTSPIGNEVRRPHPTWRVFGEDVPTILVDSQVASFRDWTACGHMQFHSVTSLPLTIRPGSCVCSSTAQLPGCKDIVRIILQPLPTIAVANPDLEQADVWVPIGVGIRVLS